VSTKSNESTAAYRGEGAFGLSSETRLLTGLKLRFDYFTGRAWWNERETGGAGTILRFERVRPRRPGRFQPLRSGEITPRFLERTIRALKRWRYDIVTMDEVCRRAVIMRQRRRFVCLTFDGCYKDVIASAYPILSRHRAPFMVYVPTVFPDGLGEAWWFALESIVARENRLSLMIDRSERHYSIRTIAEKNEAFAFLSSWLRQLAPQDLTAAIQDLCRRYSVDLAELSRKASMDWTDLAQLAADPLVTIGCATVNYSALSNLKDPAALREMTIGRTVLESAFQREIRHFAYPFGDRASFRRAHVVLAEEAGFISAASTIPGIVDTEGRTNLRALPRLSWDGRERSLRVMRVMLSGSAFAPVKPTRAAPGI
jgi:peptidoglycan/xylan/chitin deacetylase (PgdA/CDA1 family)